jgi:predicted ATPase/signal transduction histidine kinase
VSQLLRALHADGLIEFDDSVQRWTWSIDQIRERGVTAGVVDLLVERIGLLPLPTRRSLQHAACIGGRFDLDTLARVLSRPVPDVARSLRDAVHAGLIHAIDADWQLAELGAGRNIRFRFLHDRVQQAAHETLDAASRSSAHLTIARALMSEGGTQGADLSFEIASHLNEGLPHDAPRADQLAAVRANLAAARRAFAAAAWEPSDRFYTAALSRLPDDAWQTEPELAADLMTEGAHAALLVGRRDAGERLAATALAHLEAPVDRAAIHEVLMTTATKAGDLPRALAEGIEALRLLQFEINVDVDLPGFFAEAAALSPALSAATYEDFAGLPNATDAEWTLVLRVATTLAPPLYMRNPLATLLVYVRILERMRGRSLANELPYVLASWGMIQAVFFQNASEARRYGEFAVRLADRISTRRLRCKTLLLVAAFDLPWTVHLRDTIPMMEDAIQLGLDSGELEFTGYSVGHIVGHLLYSGVPLDSVLRDIDRYLPILRRHRVEISEEPTRQTRQATLNLMGRSADPLELVGESYDQTTMLPALLEAKNYSSVSALQIHRVMLACFFRDARRGLEAQTFGTPFFAAQVGLVYPTQNAFHAALLHALAARSAEAAQRDTHLEQISGLEASIKGWAAGAPMNHQHHLELVQAELASLRGDTELAVRLYDAAIANARANGYLQDEALGFELRAEDELRRGDRRRAADSIREAMSTYRRWGAEAKVVDLMQRYPEFAPSRRRGAVSATATASMSVTSSSATSGVIDSGAISKASMAIAAEIVLPRLLDRLMAITIENAGATRGVLFLDRDTVLRGAAERDVTAGETRFENHPVDAYPDVPRGVIQYCGRTLEPVVLHDAPNAGPFQSEPYIVTSGVRSVLCVPLANLGRRVGVLYLENNLAIGAFTESHVETLRLLSGQAALSLHNAMLYERLEEANRTLEERVEQRTQELRERNEQIQETLARLRDTQRQLVAQEKLASLGTLTAGVAHEIRNPLNFINNFALLSARLAGDLSEIFEAERTRLDTDVVDEVADITSSLSQNLEKINEHGRRANQIIEGMLMHSRGSNGQKEPAPLNTVVSDAVTLAYHGLRGSGQDINVRLVTEYDPAIGLVPLVVSDLSRVFINMVNNASYALQQKAARLGADFVPEIRVSTERDGGTARIRVRDNGTGIPAAAREKLFTPFFTTKPTGQGTGLGLSISHDVVVGGHGGRMGIESEEGRFTEVVIEIPLDAAG